MAIGKLLDISYNSMIFSDVKDKSDFFNTKLPEMIIVKALYNNIKLTMKIPEGKLLIQCSEGDRIYKFIILSNNIHKYPIGWFVYLPLQKRLDLYIQDNPHIPFIQWKNKKPVFKNYDTLLDIANLDKIFINIINSLG